MTTAEYTELRAAVIEQGYGREVEWAQTVGPPADEAALFSEYGWVVVNSGMRNQVAVTIWGRITGALMRGAPVSSAFGHKGKAAAIQDAWDRRDERFAEFEAAREADRVFEWIDTLPWIGKITRWHLAKNLGVDCAKPDRWLERVAGVAGESVEDLCARLAEATGDRVATVDLVIWRACNLGLWGSGQRALFGSSEAA